MITLQIFGQVFAEENAMDWYDWVSYGFGAVVVGSFVFIYLYFAKVQRQRLAGLKALARKRGWEYSGCDATVVHPHLHLNTFRDKDRPRMVNVLKGSAEGLEFVMGDYDYIMMSGRNKPITADQTICMLFAPEMRLPHFFLYRKRPIIDAFRNLIDGKNIVFSEDEKFSAAFVLQGANVESARSFFDQRIRNAFMRFASSDFTAEAWKNTLLIHRGALLPVQEWEVLLKDCIRLHKALARQENKDISSSD